MHEKLWGERQSFWHYCRRTKSDGASYPMIHVDDLGRSIAAFDHDSTLVVVIEMSKSSWLVAGMIPGVDRQPVKKLYQLPENLTPW